MNSSKKKTRRKVRCRKISSTKNLSTSRATPAGNYRRQINSLLKNNKELAVTLEDARCELSNNRKFFNESTEYLNKIKFARFKMLKMYSVLQSFLKDFDETLLLLKFDGLEWPEFGTADRLHNNFKMNMDKVDEEIPERVSADEDIVTNSEYSSDHLSSHISNTSNVCTKKFAKKVNGIGCVKNSEIINQSVQDCVKNSSCNQKEDIYQICGCQLQLSLHEDSKGIGVKEGTAKSVSPIKVDEGSNTPKLSLSLKATDDLEASPELKLNSLHADNSSQTVIHSNITTIPSIVQTKQSSQKPQTSKIPRFQDLPMKSKESNFSTKKKPLVKEKNTKRKLEKGIGEPDSNSCRRKTFLIKDNTILSNQESCNTFSKNLADLEEGKVLNEHMLNSNEQFDTLGRRKTFVVKTSNILGDVSNSGLDRRKTFVKNSDNDFVSVKDKSGIFTVSGTEFTIPTKDENMDSKISNVVVGASTITDKTEKNTHLHANNLNINSHSPINDKSVIGVNHILNNTISADTNISSKTNSEEIQHSDVIDIENIKNLNAVNSDLPRDIQSIEVIDISDSTKNARSCKNTSYKLFLEPSDSECESVADDDISFVKTVSTIKTTPVRKHASNSKDERVFVFNGKKRKSILKNSKIPTDTFKKVAEVGSSDVQSRVLDKSVRFLTDEQMHRNSPEDNKHSDSSNKDQTNSTNVKSKSTSKYKYKSSDNAVIDDNNPINVLHSISNKDLNDISSNVKQNKYLNKEHDTADILPCKPIDVLCSVENKMKTQKVRNMKRNQIPSADNIDTDDLISVAKKSKNSVEKIKISRYLEDEAIIPEDCLNGVIEDKSVKVKTKKHKTKMKVKKDLSFKKTGKNTFLVQAEVHPPPPSINVSESEDLNKENEEMLGLKNFKVSVVLNDILKSQNIDMLNISCEKDLLSAGKTSPQKTPFSDNSCNIPLAPIETINVLENAAVITKNCEGDEKMASRRRKNVKSYKEPSLMRKMRR